MKSFKKLFGVVAVCCSLTISTQAHAGIPVIDFAAVAGIIEQVLSWIQQYEQMYEQIEQAKTTYESINGARGMGSLVNDASSRGYLPDDYQSILSNGVGDWDKIYNQSKKFDIGNTSLSSGGDAGQLYQSSQKQVALNRASSDEAYKAASKRFSNIQTLLDQLNSATDDKDIQDLQGRIDAETTMMTNEANKLQALAQAGQAQRDIQAQQSVDIAMKSSKGGLPAGW